MSPVYRTAPPCDCMDPRHVGPAHPRRDASPPGAPASLSHGPLDTIIAWFKALPPRARAGLSLEHLHTLSKALGRAPARPSGETVPDPGKPNPDESAA